MRVRLPAVITIALALCAIVQSTHLPANTRVTASTVAIAPQKNDASVRHSPTVLNAQNVITRNRNTRSTLPVTVDGGKTPELIPDWLAYHQFIRASAMPTTPSAKQSNRNEARFDAIGFSQIDRNGYVAALANVREELDQVAADQENVGRVDTPTARAMRKVLRGRKDQILEDARLRLQTALTFDGWVRLNGYVQNQVKTRLIVYGSMPQLQAAVR
jgi:hypothetical protein